MFSFLRRKNKCKHELKPIDIRRSKTPNSFYCPVIVMMRCRCGKATKLRPLEECSREYIRTLYINGAIHVNELDYVIRMTNIKRKLDGTYFLTN